MNLSTYFDGGGIILTNFLQLFSLTNLQNDKEFSQLPQINSADISNLFLFQNHFLLDVIEDNVAFQPIECFNQCK